MAHKASGHITIPVYRRDPETHTMLDELEALLEKHGITA